MKIGILGAMQEEVSLLVNSLGGHNTKEIGGRIFHSGTLAGHDIAVAFSRWGKVASASTATTLINEFDVDLVVFTGVAGAVEDGVKIGDVIIANQLVQHDMDARPFFDKFQIPLTNHIFFTPRADLQDKANDAAEAFLSHELKATVSAETLLKFSIFSPKVRRGIIASGDKFISNKEEQNKLKQEIPGLIAVEMEGAAVAQVCEDHKVPYVVIRTISDTADHNAELDFQSFINSVSNYYSEGIVKSFVNSL